MSEVVKELVTKAGTGLGRILYSVITDGVYGEVKFLGHLIEMNITHNGNSLNGFGGNKQLFDSEGYTDATLTFSVYSIPDNAKIDILGYVRATAETGGGLFRPKKPKRPYIAIMIEQTGIDENDNEYTDYITLFKGKLGIPETKGKTKENNTPELQTNSLTGTFVIPDGMGDYKYVVSSDQEGFNATEWATKWGVSVVIPQELIVSEGQVSTQSIQEEVE